jgi:hypothetical protein
VHQVVNKKLWQKHVVIYNVSHFVVLWQIFIWFLQYYQNGWHSLKSTSFSLNGIYSWNSAKIQVLCDVMLWRGEFPDVSNGSTRGLLHPQKWGQHDPSRRLKKFTQRHDVTSPKIWIFSNAAVRTWNLASEHHFFKVIYDFLIKVYRLWHWFSVMLRNFYLFYNFSDMGVAIRVRP